MNKKTIDNPTFTILRFYVFYGFLLTLLITSCTEPFEMRTANSEPVVVIYGCLSEDYVHQTVRVTLSSPYFELEPNKPVSGAVVLIRTSDLTFELVETSQKGVYQTKIPMAATVGETYHLSVIADSHQNGMTEQYEATATMQRPFAVDSITITERNLMGFKHYALNLYAQEEEGPDYYCAHAIINDSLSSARLSRYIVFSDYGMDGQYLDGVSLMQFEDYENADNEEINARYNFVKPGDKVTFCISLIERGYYDFIQQCQSERRGENPFFGGPASNIATNISNGGVGYFAAFSTTRLDAYVP